MQGLKDHCFRFTSDELFNGLQAQLVEEWSAWGVNIELDLRKFIMPLAVFTPLPLYRMASGLYAKKGGWHLAFMLRTKGFSASSLLLNCQEHQLCPCATSKRRSGCLS